MREAAEKGCGEHTLSREVRLPVYHGITTGNNELVNLRHRAIDNDGIVTEDALSGLCHAKGSGLMRSCRG